MAVSWKKGLIQAIVCVVCGCATYNPAPLKPQETARQFQRRTLVSPELCAYLKQNPAAEVASCPPRSWNLSSLTLVGFYYSPELKVAEAELNVARAAIITAAQRPNPSIGLGPAYTASAAPSFAPWAIGAVQINFPIETAGRRGYRIAQARRLADASAIAVGEAAWRVRSAIRAALLNYIIAQPRAPGAQHPGCRRRRPGQRAGQSKHRLARSCAPARLCVAHSGGSAKNGPAQSAGLAPDAGPIRRRRRRAET